MRMGAAMGNPLSFIDSAAAAQRGSSAPAPASDTREEPMLEQTFEAEIMQGERSNAKQNSANTKQSNAARSKIQKSKIAFGILNCQRIPLTF